MQSDLGGGGEYIGKSLQSFLVAHGISHHKSCPYTPEQNCLAERKHKHIVETTITLLQNAHLPLKFWTFACNTAIYLINIMPSSVISNKSHFEMLYFAIPEIQHLRVFGYACYPFLKPYNNNKLQPKLAKCVFLGYASNYKGYICYELSHKRIYISRHVIFNENDFPYVTLDTKPISHPKPDSHTYPYVVPNLQNILVTPPTSLPLLPDTTLSSSSPQPSPHSSFQPLSQPTSQPLSQSIVAQGSLVSVAPEFCPETL